MIVLCPLIIILFISYIIIFYIIIKLLIMEIHPSRNSWVTVERRMENFDFERFRDSASQKLKGRMMTDSILC